MSLDTTITPIDKPTDVSQPTQLAENPPGVETTPGGARANIDLGAPTAAQLAAPTEVQSAFLKTVPADYADKDWVKNFAKTENPVAELYKSYEEQRATISRKTDAGLKIPDATATPEQRAEFYKALGVPEKPEGYEYTPPAAPKGLEKFYQPDEKLLGKVREAAFKEGMTPAQWKAVTGAFDGYLGESLQAQAAQADQLLKDAQNTFNKNYGEKGPAVLANMEKAASSAPEWARPILQNLQPVTKAAIASLLFDFSTKYVGEDRLDVKSLQGQPEMTKDDYGNEFEKAYATAMAFRRKPQSPEYLGAMQKIATLRSAQREQAVGKR